MTEIGWPPKGFLMRSALLDAVHSAYADWLAEALAVERLYTRWRDATREEQALAYAAYSAALDREQRAQEVYADMLGMAARHPRAAA
jgi:hypothetical protein